MKILIIRLSSLGDIILTQPVCASLQSRFPGCEIHFVCKPEYVELPSLFELPVKVIPYRKSLGFHLGLLRESYDLVLDLHGKFASLLIMLFCRSRRKAVYSKQRGLRKAIVAGKTNQAIDSTVSLYFSALEKLGWQDIWANPRFRNSAPKPSESDSQSQQVACFPGATYFTKRWPVEYWIQLINSSPQIRFTLLGGSSELDLCRDIATKCGDNCQVNAGNSGLTELYDQLHKYDLIISGDTGPMHLAAASGKAQIAIFGGTHPSLGFRPLNDRAVILSADLSCQPCSLHGLSECPQGHFNCMKSLKPDLVIETMSSILAGD